jgi:hypothetical protein
MGMRNPHQKPAPSRHFLPPLALTMEEGEGPEGPCLTPPPALRAKRACCCTVSATRESEAAGGSAACGVNAGAANNWLLVLVLVAAAGAEGRLAACWPSAWACCWASATSCCSVALPLRNHRGSSTPASWGQMQGGRGGGVGPQLGTRL